MNRAGNLKVYRLRPNEAGLRELARRVFAIDMGAESCFSEQPSGECSLTWRVGGATHILWIGARQGRAVLGHEWMERDRLGFRRHCCAAEQVTIAALLEMEMLNERGLQH